MYPSAQLAQPIGAISNALADNAGSEMLAPTIKHIPLDRIRPDAAQPLRRVVQEGPEWEGLVCGERRWRAACTLGMAHIAARIVRDEAMLAERAEIQLLENSLRVELSPLDELDACLDLLQRGRKRYEVAELLGVTPGLVSQILGLERIAPDVRAYIRAQDLRLSRRKLSLVAACTGAAEQMAALQRGRRVFPTIESDVDHHGRDGAVARIFLEDVLARSTAHDAATPAEPSAPAAPSGRNPPPRRIPEPRPRP